MTFKFSRRSLKNLEGVHPDLVRVLNAALDVSTVDFGIIEGVRSSEKQHEYFVAGKSQLDDPPSPGQKRGRHLTGHAIDFAAWKDGKFSFDPTLLREVAEAAKICAKHMGVAIIYGGDWTHFIDGDHIELDRKAYPDPEDAPLIV